MYIRPGFIVVIVGCTLTSLSTIIMAMRYYCRYFLMGTVGATDHLMFMAVLFTWGNTTINYFQDVSSSHFRPSQFRNPAKKMQVAAYLKEVLVTWYLYRIMYVLALFFVKMSILFFYRTIASHATFRRLVYISMTVISLYTFAIMLAAIFQCDNPSDSWDVSAYLSQFDGVPGRRKFPKCYDPTKLYVASAALNLFSDVFILLLPIPSLLSLRVPMNKRLALIGIFSIGIMAIVASCVRMWVMALWSQSPQNSAQFGADLLLWGQVETNSGIISASIPFLRLIFKGRPNAREITGKQRAPSPPKIPEVQADGKEKQPGETDNKPLQMKSMDFFSEQDRDGEGSPVWKPFITVPESLSSGSRGSELLEPTRPHLTV